MDVNAPWVQAAAPPTTPGNTVTVWNTPLTIPDLAGWGVVVPA